LDDLHSRKTARFYTELIEREFEELANIIKLQKPNDNDEQSITVSSILDALSEAHQMTAPVIKNFQTLQNSSLQKKSAPLRSFDDFENELNSALETASPQSPEREKFFAALNEEVANYIDSIDVDYKRAAYSLQRLISEEVLLAEEITKVFARALSEINSEIECENIERDILAGIKETIDIKISGLRESIQAFSSRGSEILKSYSEEKNTPQNERESVSEKICAAWLDSPPHFLKDDKIHEFFSSHEEIFATCRERIKKQVGKYTENLEKVSFRFKKEVLLYEVCTFEEILIHSVSRLRVSKNADVFAAAQMLDNAFRELEVILKKNNIAVIRPAPKDIFNAKEHEVLVAEKHDGFEKGEIIKIITAGYRFKEQVVLRANIIAAR
jgi:molecular chaperone GrpE (heat shock protein)